MKNCKKMTEIHNANFIELATREAEWMATVETTKISADEFYSSHRTSCFGEQSYRKYTIEKLTYIQKYTDQENLYSAYRSIIMGKNDKYDVPIEFSRFLVSSIEERLKKARELIKKLL